MRLLRISEKFPKGIPVTFFLLLAVSAILVTRLLFVNYTRGWEQFPDIRIYQAVGKTVLMGINPYDYADKPELRRQLRLESRTAPGDFVTRSQAVWDLYMSANPPGSTLLYAAFEKIAHGSRFVWRQLFILGDIAILLGMASLINTLPDGMADVRRQAGVFCLSVLYSFLSLYKPFISEDKQFQTAFMLFAAAALLAAHRKSVAQAFFQGVLLSVSVLFKVFGIILLPLWFSKMRYQKLGYMLWSVSGGCVPAILMVLAFGISGPLTALANRGANSGFGYPLSASPWRLLLPQMSIGVIVAIKITTILSCCTLLVVLLRKGKIDMLNFCAGLGVVLGCLWFQNGSIDRLNILVMFALASVVTLSANRFALLALIATIVSGISFAMKFPEGSDEVVDAQMVGCVLLAYFATLISFWVFPETKASHASVSREPLSSAS